MIDPEIAWQALIARDRRFDGLFFVGVVSTGIYCRPVCPARSPLKKNCLFFASAGAAEAARFRPCLRCRPELAPGNAPVDKSHRLADRLIQRIEEGLLEERDGLEAIAAEFDLSLRQLRRIVRQELGVSPLALKQTRRMRLARQLLIETMLPITDIAYASGFNSLRRFNEVFRLRYHSTPGALRKNVNALSCSQPADSATLCISYHPPYDWTAMLDFLRLHIMQQVEAVEENSYRRTVQLNDCRGWICVSHRPEKQALQVEFSTSLTPELPLLLRRVRDLFDLDAQPLSINAHLAQDPLLVPGLTDNPGLRVPGAFDAFELGVRAILGQQVSVKASTTLSSRFASAFGESCDTPFAGLTRFTAQPSRIASATVDEIASLGIVSARSRAIIAFAQAWVGGELGLQTAQPAEEIMKNLVALPGIGPWTAHYIAMRALHWPDAFPKEDIAIRNSLGRVSAAEAEARSQQWRPWRSYAVMHIWQRVIADRIKSA